MNNQEKLINILKEIFMLDKAELDNGIYKIMNQKRKDIEQFLYNDLLPQVNKILSQTQKMKSFRTLLPSLNAILITATLLLCADTKKAYMPFLMQVKK